MQQTLTPEKREEVDKARDEAVEVKPMGIQYEKNANKKTAKQKISKKHNNRKQYASFKS